MESDSLSEYMELLVSQCAEVMFNAYNVQAGGKTWDGKPIPPWSDVGDRVRANWRAAARAGMNWSREKTADILAKTMELMREK